MRSKSFYILSLAIFVSTFAVFASCSQKIAFKKSTVVPGASIEAKVGQDANENYIVELEIENLAAPQALTPSKKVYVAWVEHQYGYQNIGQIKLNKNQGGSLKSTTPFKPKSIIVTAENEAIVVTPGTVTVLESAQLNLE